MKKHGTARPHVRSTTLSKLETLAWPAVSLDTLPDLLEKTSSPECRLEQVSASVRSASINDPGASASPGAIGKVSLVARSTLYGQPRRHDVILPAFRVMDGESAWVFLRPLDITDDPDHLVENYLISLHVLVQRYLSRLAQK